MRKESKGRDGDLGRLGNNGRDQVISIHSQVRYVHLYKPYLHTNITNINSGSPVAFSVEVCLAELRVHLSRMFFGMIENNNARSL